MMSLSAGAAALLGASHRVVIAGHGTSAFSASSLTPIPGSDGPRVDLAISGGQVTIDYDAAIRRRCTVQLADPTPALDGTLNVHGSEMRLFRGVRLDDGTDELVPLGVFGVARIRTTDSGAGPQVTVDGYDRARAVGRPKLLVDLPTENTFTAHRAIVALLSPFERSILFANTDWATEPYTASATDPLIQPQRFSAGANQWDAARKVAADIGEDLAYDADGIPRCIPVPDWSQARPVWRFTAGADGTLVELAADRDNERAYNAVVMTGGTILGVSQPSRTLVTDDNPESPTWWLGRYGQYPEVTSNPSTIDPAVLAAAAAARLRRNLGRLEEVTVTATCNPAIDVGDCVLVDDTPAAVAANYVVVRATIPLDPAQPMQATCWPKRALA